MTYVYAVENLPRKWYTGDVHIKEQKGCGLLRSQQHVLQCVVNNVSEL